MKDILSDRANLDAYCMLYDRQKVCCRATQQKLSPGDRRRRIFCLDDNYDNCPFYLAYLLRHSRPKSWSSWQEEFLQK